jgi:peptidoglycan L-alanyl-D-glutamate endopeptidase CwlK
MSQPLTKDDVLFRQRLLKSSGFDPGKIDGAWGPKTAGADDAFAAAAEALKVELGTFDARTEAAIATLHIKAQAAARRFMAKAKSFPVVVKILSGTRTYAEQDALYAKGRGFTPGPKITNAKGGQSNHNFGIAWDVGLFENAAYLTGANARENGLYDGLGAAVGDLGLEWGGAWSSFKDRPHYQLPTGKKLADVRTLFEQGAAFV